MLFSESVFIKSVSILIMYSCWILPCESSTYMLKLFLKLHCLSYFVVLYYFIFFHIIFFLPWKWILELAAYTNYNTLHNRYTVYPSTHFYTTTTPPPTWDPRVALNYIYILPHLYVGAGINSREHARKQPRGGSTGLFTQF